MSIDRQFFVQLQGRDFVVFAGLLDAATRAGLRSVVTTPIQIASPENGHMAVMKARVEFEDGRVFEAIGDASPQSCGRMIHPHVQRMAETRAVGRAFRWALNVSVAMQEELGGEEPVSDTGHAHQERAVQQAMDGSVGAGVRGGSAASAPARAAARPQGASNGANPVPPRCQAPGCERFLTSKQRDESVAEFGELLCPIHAKAMADAHT